MNIDRKRLLWQDCDDEQNASAPDKRKKKEEMNPMKRLLSLLLCLCLMAGGNGRGA